VQKWTKMQVCLPIKKEEWVRRAVLVDKDQVKVKTSPINMMVLELHLLEAVILKT
jgi:hypothetical protein